jgi:hypothetical protein
MDLGSLLSLHSDFGLEFLIRVWIVQGKNYHKKKKFISLFLCDAGGISPCGFKALHYIRIKILHFLVKMSIFFSGYLHYLILVFKNLDLGPVHNAA